MLDFGAAASRQISIHVAEIEDWLLAKALGDHPVSDGEIHSYTHRPERTVLIGGVPTLELHPPKMSTRPTDTGWSVEVTIPYRWLIEPPSKDTNANQGPAQLP